VAERDASDAPVVHVPEPGASPIPSNVGLFTWDQVTAASLGSGGDAGARIPRWAVVSLFVLGVGLALFVLTTTGALS
jgi:hypothetical protein